MIEHRSVCDKSLRSWRVCRVVKIICACAVVCVYILHNNTSVCVKARPPEDIVRPFSQSSSLKIEEFNWTHFGEDTHTSTKKKI